MCRVLILDDDKRDAETLKLLVEGFEENHFVIEAATDPLLAVECAKTAVERGQPFTVFIVDQRLGEGRDGIDVLKELLFISRESYAVILTGNNDSEVGRRAYEAGAYRYLTKPADEREMEFVLKSVVQNRRAELERQWRGVFSEMMETALQCEDFKDVAKAVVKHCLRLGFERAHLFWSPLLGDEPQGEAFIGIACEGEECQPSFPGVKFNLSEKMILRRALRSRSVVFFDERQAGEEFKAEIESIGCAYPRGGLWLLPLWSGEALSGVLLLDFGKTRKYLTADHHNLLDFLARQASVALEHSRLYNEQKRASKEMELLQRASVEMLRVANQSEDDFWYAVLTIATARFGLKFNRAWLFLKRENSNALYGYKAVGANNRQEAFRDWERDEARNCTLDSFFADVYAKRIRLTPLDALIKEMGEISLDELDEDIREALREGRVMTLEESEALERLPGGFTKTFSPSAIALLPIQAGSDLAGLFLVDNKHNGEPLKKISLDNLRTLLANAGVVWETLRERKRSEDLLDANYEILGGARRKPLSDTLQLICKTARAFSRADWASIYPFPRHIVPPHYEFDFKNVGADGELKSGADIAQEQPEVGGVSMYILQNGSLIVNDVDLEDPMIGELPLSERRFVRREGIKALAGVVVRDPDSPEKLGVLYLDYFAPHRFAETEIRHLQSFARLAAVAIANDRSRDERHQRAALRTAQRISEAAGAELNLDEVMSRILTELKVLFHGSSLCVLLYDKEENALTFAPQTLKHYQILNPEFQDMKSFPLYAEKMGSLACKAARRTQQTRREQYLHVRDVKSDPDYLPLNPNTVAEVCVSLVNGRGELLGVLALEREAQFEEEDVECVKIAARVLGQAIERSQQSDALAFKSMVASMTTWASDIAHDIKSEIGQIRGNAYLLKQNMTSHQMVNWVNEIEESVKRLADVGLLREQAKQEIPLDSSLERYLKDLTRDKDINLETRLQAQGASIKVNPHKLKQILRHLARNSARAMEDSEDKRIAVETRLLPGGKAEIRFADNGPGFSEEVRSAAFQRPVTTKDGDGGYGLLLTRQLVEDIGGEIVLRPSAPGQGAVFSIKLPLCGLFEE